MPIKSFTGTGAVLLALCTIAAPASGQIPGCASGGCSVARAQVKGYSKQLGENKGSFYYWQRQSDDSGPTAAGAGLNQTSPKDVQIIGSAIADIAKGALHASIQQIGGGGGSAYAQMVDTVQFSLPTGVSSILASVTWVLEGENSFVEGRSVANVQGAGLSMTRTSGRGTGFNISLAALRQQSASSGSLFYTKGPQRIEVTKDFTIFDGDVYTLNAFVNLAASSSEKVCSTLGGCVGYLDGSKADYGNTSYFNFALPTGVTMLSGSGTLLSNPYTAGGGAGAVPEPATWAMMILGFGLVGGALRRRRAAPQLSW
ncbi:MAG: PEPxxWA-CTERM sorting domain-containing protein [Sphingomonas phyllosphaerae]|uniref:PEPxxWA-CTERM sorting domain-containing protein n=1 Tax=Sphingomonas phyllosphaerae TaxID=257003 RepID=UPI002FFB157A